MVNDTTVVTTCCTVSERHGVLHNSDKNLPTSWGSDFVATFDTRKVKLFLGHRGISWRIPRLLLQIPVSYPILVQYVMIHHDKKLWVSREKDTLIFHHCDTFFLKKIFLFSFPKDNKMRTWLGTVTGEQKGQTRGSVSAWETGVCTWGGQGRSQMFF